MLASAVPGSHRSGWRSLHGKEGVDGSSPSEGFEKVAANRDLSRASVASVGDKGRTRSHAGGTERIDQLSLPYTKEELTGVAQLLWILLGAAIAPVVLDICERMHSRSELRATHKQRDAPGKNRTCARGLGSCASDAETCCKRRTLALEHSMRASQCASRTAKSFCGAVQGDPRASADARPPGSTVAPARRLQHQFAVGASMISKRMVRSAHGRLGSGLEPSLVVRQRRRQATIALDRTLHGSRLDVEAGKG